MSVDVGIMAYNEEKNIGRLLQSLANKVDNIYVVASGCTDNTIEIAKSKGAIVLTQAAREGKASAINLFLQTAKSDILILCSADVLPSDFCLKYLLEPLYRDDNIGMVGAHPVPTNTIHTRIGRVSHLLWSTHHQIASRWPKMGEVCAFRNVLISIDSRTAVDEVYIEFLIHSNKLRSVYAPRALVFNRGPETTSDFIKQRSRIYGGHLRLKEVGYEVSTINALRVLSVAPKRDVFTFLHLCYLEYISRKKANKHEQSTIWDISTTTKELL